MKLRIKCKEDAFSCAHRKIDLTQEENLSKLKNPAAKHKMIYQDAIRLREIIHRKR